MEEFRDSVARLVIAGEHVGSAWMVTSSIVCTANHCVIDCELHSEVDLNFPSCSISGTIVEKDIDLDIALIEVDPESHQLVPLQLIARPITLAASTQWQLHGFPVQYAEYHAGGLTLDGHINNARDGSATRPLMQLFCKQGLTLPNQTVTPPTHSPFGGVSGCPVVVSPRDSDEDVYVIGVAVHHHTAQDNILYCTPIDEVVSRYGGRLQESQLISWDANRRVLTIGRDAHGFRTNLDEHLIKSLWQDGLTGLWCNLLPDESSILTSAIERIVVQSPFSTARPNTDLHFSGAGAWQSRCEFCATDWVPVEDSTVKTTLGKYSFVELVDEELPLGGRYFDDLDDLANHLRFLCNDWALKRLRERISETFDNPVGELKYNIAPDVVVAMRKLWNEWLNVLRNDPVTLHHFFGLMLSDDGGVLMAESAAGTGPETIDRCVLRATIFALALCIALPAQLQSLRSESPGNLGQDKMSGHSSGIQTMSGLTLKMADRSHKWKTPFVMLPHLPMAWIVYRVGEARFDKEVNESGTSFNQEPASSLVLPGDVELMEAISIGLDSLKCMLKKRYSEFLMAQEQYVAEAKDVTV